jgi:hypothetical protein
MVYAYGMRRQALATTMPREVMAAAFSPPVELDRVSTQRGPLWVVRDDLLAGGTKQRAAIPYVVQKLAQGYEELVYASPFAGYEQVALAVACKAVGVRCRLFCESVPWVSRFKLKAHAYTELAAAHGAMVDLASDLAAAENRAVYYSVARPRCTKVPLGIDCSEFRTALAIELRRMVPAIHLELGGAPNRIWMTVASGTLARTLREVIAPQVELRCLDVGVLPEDDARITGLAKLPRTSVERVPELFAQPAQFPPPIPSNAHCDAKAWRYLAGRAQARDLWWNITR